MGRAVSRELSIHTPWPRRSLRLWRARRPRGGQAAACALPAVRPRPSSGPLRPEGRLVPWQGGGQKVSRVWPASLACSRGRVCREPAPQLPLWQRRGQRLHPWTLVDLPLPIPAPAGGPCLSPQVQPGPPCFWPAAVWRELRHAAAALPPSARPVGWRQVQ